jgi:hypothetical protein
VRRRRTAVRAATDVVESVAIFSDVDRPPKVIEQLTDVAWNPRFAAA